MTNKLPIGWTLKRLGDITERITRKNTINNNNVLTISAEHGFIKQDKFFSKIVASKDLSKYILLYKGDFCYNKSYCRGYPYGVFRKLKNYDVGVATSLYIYFKITDGDSNFFEYLFDLGILNKQLSIISQEGVRNHGLLNVPMEDFFNMTIPFPPLEEQKRIAEVLSLCDDVIENLTELIDKKEQYKKGVMQRLLSGEVRFKGFTDEWQKYKLLDIGISYSGLTNKNASNFIDNCNAKYVTYKSIYDSNKIDINRLEDVFVEKDEKQNLVQYGDAFFTISSETPDEVAISSVLLDKVDNTYLNSFCFGFRFDFNILLPEFARYYFRSNYIRKYTYKLSQGSTRFNLSKNKFLEMIINIPSIEEQKKIAGLLSLIDEDIENLKKQLELRKQQKKGLMQKLLTGEVRI